jgi:hypothetical protein
MKLENKVFCLNKNEGFLVLSFLALFYVEILKPPICPLLFEKYGKLISKNN